MTRPHPLSTFLSVALLALLTACSDPAAFRWEATTHGGVFTLSIDAAGEYAVVGAVHEGGSLWRISDGARLHDLNHRAIAQSALVASAFSADGRFVVTAESNSLVMWDVASGQASGVWTTEGEVQSVAVSDGGRQVLVGLRNNSAVLIDTAQNAPQARIQHASTVNAVAISPDGGTAATGADDGRLRVWNVRDASEIIAHDYPSGISVMVFSADASRLFVGRYHGKGTIFDVRSGQALIDIGYERGSVVSARFAADGRSLLTGFPAGRVVQWNLADGTPTRQWSAAPKAYGYPQGMVATAVAVRHSGEIVGGFSSGSIIAWSP